MIKRFAFIFAVLWATASLAQTVSPDGSILMAGSTGSLLTSAGTWTFSETSNEFGNLILLDGVQAVYGSAVKLVVLNGGKLYQQNAQGLWWVWNGSNWNTVNDPTPPPPLPPIILGFIARPTTVTLEWMTNVVTDSCKGDDNFSTGDWPSGVVSVTPPAGVTEFTITCTGPGGTTVATATLPEAK